MAARLLQEKSFLFLSLQEPISPLDPSRSHRSHPWELVGAEPHEKVKARWKEGHTGPGPSPEAEDHALLCQRQAFPLVFS